MVYDGAAQHAAPEDTYILPYSSYQFSIDDQRKQDSVMSILTLYCSAVEVYSLQVLWSDS